MFFFCLFFMKVKEEEFLNNNFFNWSWPLTEREFKDLNTKMGGTYNICKKEIIVSPTSPFRFLSFDAFDFDKPSQKVLSLLSKKWLKNISGFPSPYTNYGIYTKTVYPAFFLFFFFFFTSKQINNYSDDTKLLNTQLL